MRVLLLAVMLNVLVGAGASAEPARHGQVVCEWTPLYLWPTGEARPRRSGPGGRALLGQGFEVLAGPRPTPLSFELLETDIPVIETGYLGDFYWIDRQCVSVTAH